MSDLALRVLNLLGLYHERPNRPDDASTLGSTRDILVRSVFFLTNVLSTSLDWQIVFSLSRGNFKLVWAEEAEQANDRVSGWFTFVFVLLMIVSYMIFLRGKWFYLHNRDWAAFSMTEIVIYAIEDVAAIELYLLVDGFYDSDRVIDHLNVLLSNFTGYMVLGILWYRMFQKPRPPCGAFIFPVLVTVLVVLVSLASYVSLLGGKFKDAIESDESNAAFFFPILAGAWSLILFLYIIVLVCAWAKCLHWTTVNGSQGSTTEPEKHHSRKGFLTVWTLVFLATIFIGRALVEENVNTTDINIFRWVPSFKHDNLIGAVPEDMPNDTILYFGHTVDWEDSGDVNGFGSSIVVGVISANESLLANESFSYTAIARLSEQSKSWSGPEEFSFENRLSSHAVAGNRQGRIYGGFYTNETGTFGWASLYSSYRGPTVPANATTGRLYRVSVSVGGDNVKHFKIRTTDTTIVDNNSIRKVAGFPFANYSQGLVKAAGPWQTRRCTYSGNCFCTGGSNDCTVTNFVEEIGQELFGGFPGEEFGRQVSMAENNSTVLAIASTRRGPEATEHSGAVTIMYMPYMTRPKQALQWSTMSGTPLTTNETNDRFAFSLEMSADGQRLIVGAPEAMGGGAAYVYEYTADNKWELLSKLTPATGTMMTRKVQSYGYAVSIDTTGKRVAVAMETDDASFVRVYENIDGKDVWLPVGGEIDGGAPGNYAAGYSNSLSLDKDGLFLAIGDVGVDGSAGLGRVRVYKFAERF